MRLPAPGSAPTPSKAAVLRVEGLEDRLTPAGYAPLLTAPLPPAVLSRVSLAADGIEGNGASGGLSVSSDGRYVAFASAATNLVAGDTNGQTDIFRKDLVTGVVERVSVALDGTQGDGASGGAFISSSGQFVVFQSAATNLVAGDTNGQTDIFRKDLVTGQLVRVNVNGATQADGLSQNASVTPDGRYVTFDSVATNLVAGDTNGFSDVFRKDLTTGTLTRVSTTISGLQANEASADPRLSDDGRYVVFASFASNLAAGDSNNTSDVFRKDVTTGTVVRVSVAQDGTQANGLSSSPRVSSDGRFVAFASFASNLIVGDTSGTSDVFRKDLSDGLVVRASVATDGTQANDLSTAPEMSADGRFVVFESIATNLVPGDTNGLSDVFRKDVVGGTLLRVSNASGGAQATVAPVAAAVSRDGQFVAFESDSAALVPGDTNGVTDAFVWGRVGSAAVSTEENTTTVVTVTATDPDAGDALSYAILGGADAALFTINSATGVLRFTSGRNFEVPTDANLDNVYEVTVRVTDGTLTDAQAVSVTVTDANEPPSFTSGTAFSVAENTTAVSTLTATDPDTAPQLAFSITGGFDAARFTLNAATGVLAFVSAPNFDVPGDANGDNVYVVNVRVSDGSLTADQTLNVTVTNVNEPPVITSPAAVSVPERQALAMNVTAVDPDAGTTLTYSLAGGADAAKFAIAPGSGALTFVTPPVFNTPTDANGDNVYVVNVRVSDGTLTATRTVSVTVLPAPVLPFSDAFSPTANGGNLTANWVTQRGTFSTTGGAAAAASAGANTAVVTNIAAADVAVSATVRPQVGGLLSTGLVARYSGSGDTGSTTANMYWGALNVFGASPPYTQYLAEVWKVVNGVASRITFNGNPVLPANAVGKVLRFEVFGSSLKLYLDDVLLCFAVDTSIVAAGSVGVRTGQGAVLDDFAAVARAPVTPALPFHDSFAANPPRNTLSTNWQDRSGFFAINGAGQAIGRSAGQTNVTTLNGVTAANVTVSADLYFTGGGQTIGLMARYQGDGNGTGESNFYLAAVNAQANGNALLRILKNVNGVLTELGRRTLVGFFPGSVFTTPVTGFTFRTLGNQLSILIGATTQLTLTDNTFTAAGSVGVRTSVGVGVDEFNVTTP